MSLWFSLTNWSFNGSTFVGLRNFVTYFTTANTLASIKNTFVYALSSSVLNVTLSFFLAVFLTSGLKTQNFLRSIVFFPNVVSTVAIAITFSALMHPTKGLINKGLAFFGIHGPDWLGNPKVAMIAVIIVDVWKRVGISALICVAGILAIDRSYYEAAEVDGATGLQKLFKITLPLSLSSLNTVIILSLIIGLRVFDTIWVMTAGGPGNATEVFGTMVYRQYGAGYYGLSTAGNVILFLIVAIIIYPLQRYLTGKEVE